jgi:hypothetical protein
MFGLVFLANMIIIELECIGINDRECFFEKSI